MKLELNYDSERFQLASLIELDHAQWRAYLRPRGSLYLHGAVAASPQAALDACAAYIDAHWQPAADPLAGIDIQL